jgi:hypothetical protein
MSFGRSGFSRDPCAIEGGRFGIVRGGFIRGLWNLEGKGSGRKPLLPKRTMSFGRSGFRRDPCVIEDRRFGIAGVAFICGLGDLEGRRFGAEAPPTKKNDVVLVGAASAATLAPPKTEGLGLQGAPSSVAFGILKAGDSGRKPLLPKRTMSFGRSGFRRDPCATEDRRFGIAGGAFIRGLWDLEGRRFGAKAPPTEKSILSPSIALTPYTESRVIRRMTKKPRRTSISIRPSRA